MLTTKIKLFVFSFLLSVLGKVQPIPCLEPQAQQQAKTFIKTNGPSTPKPQITVPANHKITFLKKVGRSLATATFVYLSYKLMHIWYQKKNSSKCPEPRTEYAYNPEFTQIETIMASVSDQFENCLSETDATSLSDKYLQQLLESKRPLHSLEEAQASIINETNETLASILWCDEFKREALQCRNQKELDELYASCRKELNPTRDKHRLTDIHKTYVHWSHLAPAKAPAQNNNDKNDNDDVENTCFCCAESYEASRPKIIFACHNTHHACRTCFDKLRIDRRCPFCKAPLRRA